MLSLAIFGGNRVDGSMLDPGERVVALALFGGVDVTRVDDQRLTAADGVSR